MSLTFQGVAAAGGVANGGAVVVSVSEDAGVGELLVIFVAHDQPGSTPAIDLECTLLAEIEGDGFALAVFYTILEGDLTAGFSEITADLSDIDPNADLSLLALHAAGVTDGITAGFQSDADSGTSPATPSHVPSEASLFLCGFARDGGAAEFTVGSGWTDVATESNAGGLPPRIDVEYRNAGSGTITGDGTLSASQNWAAIMAYFTDNSGAGSDPAGADGNFLMLL